jgi:hypothetical protein
MQSAAVRFERGLGLALAALSGFLSYVAFRVPSSAGGRWGAGIAFGLLVLGPTGRGPARFAALFALSVAVYRVAVWLATTLYVEASVPAVVACGLAGVLGAVAVSAGAAASGRAPLDRGATARAAAFGLAGGVLIGLCLAFDDESPLQHALLLGGYLVWQMGYTAAHRLAPWRRQGGTR